MTTKDSVIVTARLRTDDALLLKKIKEEHGMSTAGVILFAIAKLQKEKPGPKLIFPEHHKQRKFYTELLNVVKTNGGNPKLPSRDVKAIAYRVGIMTPETCKRYLDALTIQGFCSLQSDYVTVLKKWDTKSKKEE